MARVPYCASQQLLAQRADDDRRMPVSWIITVGTKIVYGPCSWRRTTWTSARATWSRLTWTRWAGPTCPSVKIRRRFAAAQALGPTVSTWPRTEVARASKFFGSCCAILSRAARCRPSGVAVSLTDSVLVASRNCNRRRHSWPGQMKDRSRDEKKKMH